MKREREDGVGEDKEAPGSAKKPQVAESERKNNGENVSVSNPLSLPPDGEACSEALAARRRKMTSAVMLKQYISERQKSTAGDRVVGADSMTESFAKELSAEFEEYLQCSEEMIDIENMEPDEKIETEPAVAPNIASSEGSAASPSDGSAASPSDGSAASPSDGSAASPSDGSAASPSDGSAASPSDRSAASPSGDDASMASSDNSQSSFVKELEKALSDEPETALSDEPEIAPSDEPEIAPSCKPEIPPSDEPEIPHSEEPATASSNEPATAPSEEPKIAPFDVGSPSREVPNRVSRIRVVYRGVQLPLRALTSSDEETESDSA